MSLQLVFIRNIPFSYAEEQVRSLFAEHNLSFSSLSMPVWKFGPHKGKGRGFAFATVSNEEEQKKTIETLNGKEIHTGEMYTPRAHKAPATALAEGSGAITAQGETQPTAAGEVAQPEPTERVLKLVARQGFENEEKNTEEQHEQEGAAADAADAAAAAAANGTGELFGPSHRQKQFANALVVLTFSNLLFFLLDFRSIGPADSGTA